MDCIIAERSLALAGTIDVLTRTLLIKSKNVDSCSQSQVSQLFPSCSDTRYMYAILHIKYSICSIMYIHAGLKYPICHLVLVESKADHVD